MTDKEEENLRAYLTSEMVSRVTLAEAVNIMHGLAVNEVEVNVGKMSEEEKKIALDNLTAQLEKAKEEGTLQETEVKT